MIIIVIILLFGQMGRSESQFNLYNTEESFMMNAFDYHCLYFDQSDFLFDIQRSLISFCIRPETPKKFNNDPSTFCYGEMITFEKLKLINVSIADLFQWNAAIESIDLYSKYLFSSNLVNTNEFFCNCSSVSQFGKSCEYQFDFYYDNEGSFTELFKKKDDFIDQDIRNQYMTYYIGIQCQTNFISLDWRQICNGIVDCDYGEDEPADLCLQMELNQCHSEEEFRCQNGLCIPISLAHDLDEDCLDRSDETDKYTNNLQNYFLYTCSMSISFQCDETNLGWKQFSCGDGQMISYSNLINAHQTCENGRHLTYLRKLFSTNDENQCWKSMICLTGFDYLYPHVIGSTPINIFLVRCSTELYV